MPMMSKKQAHTSEPNFWLSVIRRYGNDVDIVARFRAALTDSQPDTDRAVAARVAHEFVRELVCTLIDHYGPSAYDLAKHHRLDEQLGIPSCVQINTFLTAAKNELGPLPGNLPVLPPPSD